MTPVPNLPRSSLCIRSSRESPRLLGKTRLLPPPPQLISSSPCPPPLTHKAAIVLCYKHVRAMFIPSQGVPPTPPLRISRWARLPTSLRNFLEASRVVLTPLLPEMIGLGERLLITQRDPFSKESFSSLLILALQHAYEWTELGGRGAMRASG